MTRVLRVGHRDGRLRSKGCLSCIRMKVKCDELKPHCKRCLDAHRDCPGYRQPVTTFAIETSNNPKAYESCETPLKVLPRTDWTVNAINHYVHHFVVPASDGIPGLHNHVPIMYSQYRDKTYLQSAVQAVAMANFARVNLWNASQSLKAQSLYVDAVRGLRVALNDDLEARSAAALMTTEMLSQYDLIIGVPDAPMASPHRYGMMQILRRQIFDGLGHSSIVTKGAFTNLLLQNIGPTIGLPATPPPWEMYPQVDTPPDMACRFLELIARVVASCRAELVPEATQKDKLERCQELAQLERDFVEWETLVPDTWKYDLHPKGPHIAQSVHFPPAIIQFSAINATLLWMLYWMGLLDVLHTHFELLHPGAFERLRIWEHMSEIVDKLCSAVPRMTRQSEAAQYSGAGPRSTDRIIGSFFAMRCLYVVGQVSGLPRYKMNWVVQQLDDIADQTGVGQARVWSSQLRNSPGMSSVVAES